MPKEYQQHLEELGIKNNHFAKKHKQDTVEVGRYTVSKVSHNEWDISTRQGEVIDTLPSRKAAILVAKALNG